MTGLAAGDRGIDYSYARPDLAAVAKAGAKFFVRYTAGAASNPSHPSHTANAGKLITPDEFAAILAHGDLVANDEWYEGRVTEGLRGEQVDEYEPPRGVAGHFHRGMRTLQVRRNHPDMVDFLADAGATDAAAAGALWHQCGLHPGASIYVSWDAPPASSQWAAVDAYLRNYQRVVAQWGYHVDCYAGTPYLRHALSLHLIRYGWRPNAGSWSNDALPYQPPSSTATDRAALVSLASRLTPAHIWQTGNYWFNNGADEDVLVRVPIGSHKEATAPAPTPGPTPTHEGENMATAYLNKDKQALKLLGTEAGILLCLDGGSGAGAAGPVKLSAADYTALRAKAINHVPAVAERQALAASEYQALFAEHQVPAE